MSQQSTPSLVTDKNVVDFSFYFGLTSDQVELLVLKDPTLLYASSTGGQLKASNGHLTFIYIDGVVKGMEFTHRTLQAYKGYSLGMKLIDTYKEKGTDEAFYGFMGDTPIGGVIVANAAVSGYIKFKVTDDISLMEIWMGRLDDRS